MTKADLQILIDSKAKESVIETELKKNMALLAEVYASPKNEYIIIPQFTIDDGSVDYILLTGRSSVKIYLIELKGADFSIINQDLKAFNADINYAVTQLTRRKRVMEDNRILYKDKIRKIVTSIKDGTYTGNYLMGKSNDLLIDYEKTFKIVGMVAIGGYSINDVVESEKRDDIEKSTNYLLRMESWDSFIRKI